MRWWLAAAFALIAALGALATAEVFSLRYEGRLEEEAQNLAVGRAVDGTDAIEVALRDGNLDRAIGPIADRRRLAVFVYGFDGSRLTAERSLRVNEDDVPNRRAALAAALGDRSRGIEPRRYVQSLDGGRATVIGLPLDADDDEAAVAAAVVAYAPRPEFLTERGLVRGQLIEAALVAMAIAALAGLLVATLIARRLRRIARRAPRPSSEAASTLRCARASATSSAIWPGRSTACACACASRSGGCKASATACSACSSRLHEGVLTVRPDLTIEYANPAAADLLGTPGLGPGDPLPESVAGPVAARARGRPLPPGRARVAGSGQPRRRAHVRDRRHPGRVEDLSAVLVFTDISERERRERAEREFVTNAAHELRTPLTAITSAVEVLQAGAKDVARRARPLPRAHRARGGAARPSRARTACACARPDARGDSAPAAGRAAAPLLEVVAGGLAPADGVDDRGATARCRPCRAGTARSRRAGSRESGRECGQAHRSRSRSCSRRGAPPTAGWRSRSPTRGPASRPTSVSGSSTASTARATATRTGFGLGLAIVRQAVARSAAGVKLDAAPGGGTTARSCCPPHRRCRR